MSGEATPPPAPLARSREWRPAAPAADAFVFPSLTDTFGLVMAEAMACGLPVAAFPVSGPLDVVGQSGAGVLDHDLGRAAIAALDIPADRCLGRADDFSWLRCAELFLSHLSVFAAPALTGAAV